MTAPQLTQYVQGQGSVSADGLNTFMQTTNIVSDLRNFVGVVGIEVAVRGQANVNDGGGGFFYWNATGVGPDDGVNTIVPFGAATGVWSRLAGTGQVATVTVLLSGSGLYTTPANTRQLRIRMIGGGGGGSGSGNGGGLGTGSSGNNTIFNAIVANGGSGGAGRPGTGGIAGAGVATVRIAGACGMNISTTFSGAIYLSFGGGGGGQGGGNSNNQFQGVAGAANTGGGGSGGGITGTAAVSSMDNVIYGYGGGEGEYAELVINGPVSSYPFTVGTGGGGGGAGGSGGSAGGAGGSGYIIVEAFF